MDFDRSVFSCGPRQSRPTTSSCCIQQYFHEISLTIAKQRYLSSMFSAGLRQPPHNVVHPYLYIFRNSLLAKLSRHRPKRLFFEMLSQRGQIRAPPTSSSNAVHFANIKDHPCAGCRTVISAPAPPVASFRGRSCSPAKPLPCDG